MTIVDRIERLITRNPDRLYHSGQLAKRLKCHKSVVSKALAGLADRGRIRVAQTLMAGRGGPRRFLYAAQKPVYLEIYWPSKVRQQAEARA